MNSTSSFGVLNPESAIYAASSMLHCLQILCYYHCRIRHPIVGAQICVQFAMIIDVRHFNFSLMRLKCS